MEGDLGQKVFADLKSALADFSDRLTIEEGENELSIKPLGPHTFPIQVSDEGGEVIISALRWHTHAEDAEEAVRCVLWLLTPFYRIVQKERNGSWIESHVERFDPPGQWASGYVVGAVFGKFGLKRNVVRIAHQQNVLPAPSEFLEEFSPGTLSLEGLPMGSQLGCYVLVD